MSIIDKETFTYWITHPHDLGVSDIPRLEATVKAFPYCQITYYLLAKASAQTKPFKFSEAIPKAAVYALSRKALRDLIENEGPIPGTKKPDSKPVSPEEKLTKSNDTSELARQLDLLEINNRPLPKVASVAPPEEIPVFDGQILNEEIIREEIVQKELYPKTDQKRQAPLPEPEKLFQQNIIEKFIQNDPRIGSIRPVNQGMSESLDLTQRLQTNTSIDTFATESFANLFIRQGKIDKAIGIYEKLILKNPKKKDYFAQKINELRSRND